MCLPCVPPACRQQGAFGKARRDRWNPKRRTGDSENPLHRLDFKGAAEDARRKKNGEGWMLRVERAAFDDGGETAKQQGEKKKE